MAFSNFIPEVWSARLLEHLDKVHVYANLMNRDYEGEIRIIIFSNKNQPLTKKIMDSIL